MAENKKVMEEEAVDTKETKAEQTCEETKDLPHRQVSNEKKYDRKRYMDCKASSKITFV